MRAFPSEHTFTLFQAFILAIPCHSEAYRFIRLPSDSLKQEAGRVAEQHHHLVRGHSQCLIQSISS